MTRSPIELLWTANEREIYLKYLDVDKMRGKSEILGRGSNETQSEQIRIEP